MRRLAVLAAVLLVAGCGNGESAVPPSAIAVVGGQPVLRTAFASEMARAQRANHARGQAFPGRGTDAYERLKDSVVLLLVEQKQLELAARRHGVLISQTQVDRRLRRFKLTTFGGSDARYRERLRVTGMTNANVRDAIRIELLVAALRKEAPAALRERPSVVYAKGFAPRNAG
jgi:hypothetical protein